MRMDQVFLGNSLAAWTRALIAFLAVAALLEVLVFFSRKQTQKSEKPLLTIRLISQLQWFTRVALPLWAAAAFLSLPPEVEAVLRVLIIAVLAIQAGMCAEKFIALFAERELKSISTDDLSRRSSIRGIVIGARVLLWTIIALIVLESIPSFNIVSIITSLGLSGIAIGLAAQSFVKDMLSSLTIRLDKPFEIGDSVKCGEISGTVEKIALSSTTLRSINGEAVRISNSKIIDSPVQNYSRMEERFQVLSLPLAPDTPLAKIRALPALIEGVLNEIDLVSFNRCRLKDINHGSLNLEVAYTVSTPNFNDFVAASHTVNLALLDLLEQEDIRRASPLVSLQGDNP